MLVGNSKQAGKASSSDRSSESIRKHASRSTMVSGPSVSFVKRHQSRHCWTMLSREGKVVAVLFAQKTDKGGRVEKDVQDTK